LSGFAGTTRCRRASRKTTPTHTTRRCLRRRGPAAGVLLALLSALTAACGSDGSETGSGAATPAPRKPNILLIVADDLGAEAASVYPALAGTGGQAPMPNLQALAARGIVFDRVWANPVCSPTRATIVTGLYGHKTGVTNVGDTLPEATTVSLFETIPTSTQARYAMAAFGKWHLGPTAAHVRASGVPEFRGFVGGGISDYFDWTWTDLDGNTTRTSVYSTTLLTESAIEFIDRRKASSDPWFVYLAYNAPHGTGASNGFQVPPANLHSVNVGGLAPGAIADTLPVYQAMIQALDTEIGRLLAAIGPPGTPLRDNTVVIFIGDNGTPAAVKDASSAVRGFKSTVFEGGIRVPLVISGAGVARRGEREDALVVASDLYATIAELAGIPGARRGDSFSLVPLLSNSTATSGRTLLFTEMCTSASFYAIGDERYKLSSSNGIRALYDLVADPREQTNRFGDPVLAAVQGRLTAELTALAQGATAGCLN
jgi:arylsulfatase A-like enzyme